ncbi:MAG: EAL domain-containing protein [Actinobacteria bacterium]|nr:MAG: EAL domain-containing protein [Actinomycetota bacterium]
MPQILAFARGQLDYILFIHGLGLIVLATAAVPLRKLKGIVLHWGWFALFCLFVGFNDLVALVAYSFGDGPVLLATRSLLLFTAFIALVEFARDGAVQVGWRAAPARPIVHLSLSAIVIGLSLVWGEDGLDVALRGLALIGCIWAGAILFIGSRRRSGFSRHLLIGGLVGFSLYSLVVIATRQPLTFPVLLERYPPLVQAVVLLVPVPIALLAMCLAGGIWVYEQGAAGAALDDVQVDNAVRQTVVISSVVLVGVFAGWLLTDSLGRYAGAIAAMISRRGGPPVAVMGMRVASGDFGGIVSVHRTFGILVTSVLAALTITFFIARQRTKESALHLSALKIAERDAANERRLRKITSTLGEGVFVVDREGTITFVNPEAERLLGWEPGELLNTCAHDTVKCRVPQGEILSREESYIFEPIETGIGRRIHDGVFLRKNGSELPVYCVSTPMVEEGKIVGSVVAFQDISERKRADDTIKRMAYLDLLTRLPNRTLFNDRLVVALAQAHRNGEMVCVMCLDLDRFKTINDTLGHARGDRLLRHVAARLTRLVREGDTVARLGGDEFALLLPQVRSEEDAGKVARKVLKALQAPCNISGHDLHPTASIGISLYPVHGRNAEILLKNTDIAMYRAKEEGGNNYQLYRPEMERGALYRLAVESKLRSAIERHELVLHYQPQVSIKTGDVVGLEALLRWRHAERGLIEPSKFVPVAEETGLIVPISEWVLTEACSQNKAWQDAGYAPVRVAVNLSAKQFQQPDLVEKIAGVLNETGLDGRYLELEITESIAMLNVEVTIDALRRLGEMGIRIAIDDFGTGYSSLNLLKRFPIHTLKLAQAFVADVTGNEEGAAIASTMLVLAENLGLNAVAEGVETEEQLEFLKAHNCNEMQGYLFSVPLPPEEVPAMLKMASLVTS